MMAFDHTRPVTLGPETVEALRSAFARSLAQGNHDDELGALLSRAADEARGKGIQSEHLLVILKDVWFSLPELASRTGSDAETALLQDLISRCIREYYR